MEKVFTITRRSILILVVLAFLAGGVLELMGKLKTEFMLWPPWSLYIIATIELLGACGLFYSKTARLAMMLLTVTTVLSVLTHIGHHAWFKLPTGLLSTGIILLALFGLMYLQAKRSDPDSRWGFF